MKKQNKNKGTTGTGPGVGGISLTPEFRFVEKQVLQLQAENKKLREQLKQQNSNNATQHLKQNKMDLFEIRMNMTTAGHTQQDTVYANEMALISEGSQTFVCFYQTDKTTVPTPRTAVAIYNAAVVESVRRVSDKADAETPEAPETPL